MPPKPSTRPLKLEVLVFTTGRLILSTAFRMVYPLLPAFRDGLGVSLQSLSNVLGLRALVGAGGSLLLSSVPDGRGRRAGMLLGVTLFVAGSTLVVFWPTFGGFVAALMLTTLGKFVFDPSVQAYLGDRVPYERRSLALSVTELSWSGGFIFGIPAMGWLIARAGWVAPFPLLGLLMLALGLVLARMLPREETQPGRRPRLSANFRSLLASPQAMAMLAFTAAVGAANEVVNIVFGVWMEASFGLQLTALGAAAAVLGAAELGGEGLVALFTDRLGKRRALFIGLAANSLAAVVLTQLGGSLAGALVGLALFYVTFEFLIVSSIPLLTEVLPAARATMMAGFFTSASLGRAGASWLAPLLYGSGFAWNIAAAIVLNVVGMLILTRVSVD